MKKIYIAVLILLSVSVILFIASFFYLDGINHKTFYYVIRSADKDIGTIKIERFATEDKIIYKSLTALPFEPIYTEYSSRLVLDKKYNIESYTRQRTAGRNTDMMYLENFKNLISFVSRYQSKFVCVENIPIRKETFVFEEDSPVTYLPIIENYNFLRGRSQGFNAISCFQAWNLPPMKRFITFTSIKDEHIKIDSHKIKTENLLLKIRDYPQGALWVRKSSGDIIKLDIPAKDMTILRTFRPRTIKAANREVNAVGYAAKDVLFKSRDINLAGTLTYPLKEGKFPAVLFSPGSPALDRDYEGLFANIADHLSRSGFVNLRFDKRGVGFSGGEFSSSTGLDDTEDLDAALQYLRAQSMVDPNTLILIGHARGGIYAIKAASRNNCVKGVVLMAPTAYPDQDYTARIEDLNNVAVKAKWTDDYRNLAVRTIQETQGKIAASVGDWIYILGKRCFLGSMKEELANKPLNPSEFANPAFLILQGKDTDNTSADNASLLDKAISDSGNTRHKLTYYAYLASFFGRMMHDGMHRNYYDTDIEVLENIRGWVESELAKNSMSQEKAPAA